MKIAISSQEAALTSPVACHFGRCCFFFIYDDNTGKMEWLGNCDKEKKGCAGEAVLHSLIEKKVNHIISANFGKNVQQEMTEKEIRMTLLTDCSKTVGDILRIINHKQLHKTI